MSDNHDDVDLPQRKKSAKKLLFTIIGFAVLVVLIGAYGTFAYLQRMWPFEATSGVTASQIASGAAGDQAAAAADTAEEFISFDSAFTFNLTGRNNRSHMVQVGVVLAVRGSSNAELAKQHLPLISATISEICSQQQYEALASATGRQRFKHLLLDGIRTKLTGVTNEPIVDQVLFVNFVMQ